MTVEEFIKKWKDKRIPSGAPVIGIVVNWHKILPNAKVVQHFGEEAWNKIYDFSPPWNHETNQRRAFRHWIEAQSPNYWGVIKKESITYHCSRDGLEYPFFCAFADATGGKGVLADGNHRFLICDYLKGQGQDFSKDIEQCTLDILCLPNLFEVIQVTVFPNY